MACIGQAANFAGLLAWRENAALLPGPVRCLPTALPGQSDPCRVKPNAPPQWRTQSDSAVQSRVGDGFPVSCLSISVEGQTSATKCRLPVFPSTKFAIIVRGRSPLRVVNVPRFRYAAPGLTRKHLGHWQQTHTRTTVSGLLYRERRLKNLF